MDHLEPLVDQAIAALRSWLPDRLRAGDAERGAFGLQPPHDDDYYPGGAPQIMRYPAVEVSAVSERLVEPAVAAVDLDATAVVFVVVWVEDMDFERLYRSTLRYGRAAIEVLLRPRVFGGWVVSELEAQYRANPETRDQQQRLAAALIRLRLDGVERGSA